MLSSLIKKSTDNWFNSYNYTNNDTHVKGIWHSDHEVKIDKKGFVNINNQKTKTFWDGFIKSVKKPKRLKIRSIIGDETIINL